MESPKTTLDTLFNSFNTNPSYDTLDAIMWKIAELQLDASQTRILRTLESRIKEFVKIRPDKDFTDRQWKSINKSLRSIVPTIIPHYAGDVYAFQYTVPTVPTKDERTRAYEHRSLTESAYSYRYHSPTPTPTPMVYDAKKYSSSSLSVNLLINLIDQLDRDMMVSAAVHPIADYFSLKSALETDDPAVGNDLKLVDKVLTSCGWHNGGFDSPPDLKRLVSELKSALATLGGR